MKKLFKENRGFRLVFLIVLVIIVNFDVWIGIDSLAQYLGWHEPTSDWLKPNVLKPVPYGILTSSLYIFSAASLVTIPLLSGWLQSEKAPIKTIIVVTLFSVALLPLVFIWSNSLNPVPVQKEFYDSELWETVNKKRKEKGVDELISNSWTCSVATIRLNANLKIGNGGFDNTSIDKVIDEVLKPFEKTPPPEKEDPIPDFFVEFLNYGANLEEVINSWENNMGSKELFTGKKYKYGCVAAQDGYGLVITAY